MSTQRLTLTSLITFFGITLMAQNYNSYFTGNTTDVLTTPAGGVCLMGGATEDDNAMTWFLNQANGGDILVIRASGSNGYNDYFYTDLGVTVNSVESIVFNDATAANETYIHQKINQAEAIWMAGGDQWNYVSYWRNTPIDSLINKAIAERNIVIGGTSAGMAILGEIYFTAENGTITSTTALNNPYATTATIDDEDFLEVPYMQNVITDTHYDNPDRRGRHVVFMARAMQDLSYLPKGIACEEYVAVCVDTFGIARVYGGYPTYDEQAYFIQMNCEFSPTFPSPSTCSPSTPLTWTTNQNALIVYKVNGTSSGANYFDLNTWQDGSGGQWQYWDVDNGILSTTNFSNLNCNLNVETVADLELITIYPNPSNGSFTLKNDSQGTIPTVLITDVNGKIIASITQFEAHQTKLIDSFTPGVYLIIAQTENGLKTSKLVVM